MRGELEDFAGEVFEPFARKDQRRWGQAYMWGLLTDGRRKSVEPMAARLGEDGNRQALAHFVTTSPWDPSHVRARLAWKMEAVIRSAAVVFERSPRRYGPRSGGSSARSTRAAWPTSTAGPRCCTGSSTPLANESSRYLAQDAEDRAEDARSRAEALAGECGDPLPAPRRRAGQASGLGY